MKSCAFVLCAVLFAAFRAGGVESYSSGTNSYFGDVPTENGPTNDPDGDGEVNLLEFAFGTDPRSGTASVLNAITPRVDVTNGVYAVQILEQNGHELGIQIDLDLSASLTNWIRPWWQRTVTNSLPSDPTNSVRELFSTVLSNANTSAWFVRGHVQLLEAGPEIANYYVATNGLDSNPGTFVLPYRSLHKAVSVVVPGNLIYMRAG